MFDIGFMELALVAVVALVVIGPERLPGVARTAGKWIGSARRFVSSVQADINLELSKTDELKRLLEEQTNIQSMHDILEQTPVEPDDRKPVPRAVPASKKTREENPLAEEKPVTEKKPEYLVKAMNDKPAVEESSASTSSTSSNKHD